jgi:hypothetical protein
MSKSAAQKFADEGYKGNIPQNLNEHGKPKFYECGICGQMHPQAWNSDCRDDANRFTIMDIEEKYGIQRAEALNDDPSNYGWEQVNMVDPDQEEIASLVKLAQSKGVTGDQINTYFNLYLMSDNAIETFIEEALLRNNNDAHEVENGINLIAANNS